MKKTITLLAVVTLGLAAIPAYAQHGHRQNDRIYHIEQRLYNQHTRIDNGITSGRLTHREARHLHKQQRHITRLKHRYMHDGYLDHHEFHHLQDKLNHASNHIYRLKHNRRQHYTYFH